MAHRRRLGAVVASFFMLMALAVPAMGATESKPYSASATDVYAGQETFVTVSITNEASPQTLGSADITVPDALNVGYASPRVIELRDLNLEPGATYPVEIAVRAQCTATTAVWDIQVKQSNDFNGTGNDFVLQGDPATTAVEGDCALAFTGQPNDSERSSVITSEQYDPLGEPVAVTVFDGSGLAPVTWWSKDVTLAIGFDPSGGTAALGGTTATPAAGVAVFAPTLDVSASRYTLDASSGVGTAAYPSLSTTSDSFDIVDDANFCGPEEFGEDCKVTSKSNKTSATIFPGEGDQTQGVYPIVSIDPADLSVFLDTDACQGYSGVSGTVQFLVDDASRSKTVSITVDASIVDRPLKKFEVCFGSPEQFTTKDGTLAEPLLVLNGLQIYSGLLPDCELPAPGPPGANPAPCVVSRDRDKTTKDVTVVFDAPASDLDPWGKI